MSFIEREDANISGPQPISSTVPETEPTPPAVGGATHTALSHVKTIILTLAVTVPLGVVTRFLIPRYLGAESAGKLFFAESFPTLFLSMMPLGIGFYIQKAVPARHEHARDILSPVLMLQLLMGFVMSLGVLGFMKFSGYDAGSLGLTGLMCIYNVLFIIQSDTMQKVLVAIGAVKEISLIHIIEKVTVIILTLGCMASGLGVVAIALSGLASQILQFALLLHCARGKNLLGGRLDPALMRTMIRFGLPFFMSTLLTTSNGSIDAFFLSKMGGYGEMGLYGMVLKVLGAMFSFVPVISNGIMPVLARTYHLDPTEYRRVSGLALRSLLLLCLPIGLGFSAFIGDVIRIAYGEAFHAATFAGVIGGPLLACNYLAIYLSTIMVFSNSGKQSAMIMTAAVATNAFCDWMFIPFGRDLLGAGGGAAGSAAASLVAEIVVCTALVTRIKPAKLWSGTTYTAVMSLLPAFLMIAGWAQWYSLSLPVRIGVMAVFLPTYVLATRLVHREELEFLRRLRPRRKTKATPA